MDLRHGMRQTVAYTDQFIASLGWKDKTCPFGGGTIDACQRLRRNDFKSAKLRCAIALRVMADKTSGRSPPAVTMRNFIDSAIVKRISIIGHYVFSSVNHYGNQVRGRR